jgi:hypothetical protein
MACVPGRYSILALLCGVLVASAVLVPGCGGYGEVSPLTYEYTKALYSICNRRDAERLNLLRDKVATSLDQQEITDQESEWLGGIIAQAESGQWKAAEKEARRLMEDQVIRP